MQDIFVSTEKFREICDKCACQKIAEGQPCQTVDVLGRRYIITGTVGSGRATYWESAHGYEVTPDSMYQGELEPLTYNQHNIEVNSGNRPRGYTGMAIRANGYTYVVSGVLVRFQESKQEAKQLEIF